MTALSPDDELSNSELAPRRLLDGGAAEHERSLIASARLDRVPSAAKARVAAALGDVLEAQPAPGAPPSGPDRAARGDAPLQFGTRSTLGVVGAGVVGAMALSLWLRATPGESSGAGSTARELVLDSSATPAEPSHAALPRVASGPPSSAAAAPGASNSAGGSPAELTTQKAPARPHRAAPRRPREGAATAHAVPVESDLLAEVRALEGVSSAIGAGQAERAARELDAYRRRFAHGSLSIEAEVLAIQIAVARGENRAASAAAERLLARPEAQHYRARVHALLEREGQPSGSANR
jgi:hypothetical protein